MSPHTTALASPSPAPRSASSVAPWVAPLPSLTPASVSWAQHLVGQPAAGAAPPPPTLTLAEAARVQRYRDQLMEALRARDRAALVSAKQQVLEAAFCPRSDACTGGAQDSPAVRRALRELTWRMAALVLPRRAGF